MFEYKRINVDEFIKRNSAKRFFNGMWIDMLPEAFIQQIEKDLGIYDRVSIDEMVLKNGVMPEALIPLYQKGLNAQGIASIIRKTIVIEGRGSLEKELIYSYAKYGVGYITGIDISADEGYINKATHQIYEGTQLAIIKSEVKKHNVQDIISKLPSLILATGPDPQSKFVLYEHARSNNVPLICTIYSNTACFIIPVFNDTKDISSLIRDFSTEVDFPERYCPVITQAIVEEGLKILTTGDSELRGSMIYMDFNKGLVNCIRI